mmetsp:Transcript_26882/g.67717  ORF Transcript_26882/g.67717 Transcript_26882/m.67717 type:complete len:289 (-) Transcript_26882:143-1009(-)
MFSSAFPSPPPTGSFHLHTATTTTFFSSAPTNGQQGHFVLVPHNSTSRNEESQNSMETHRDPLDWTTPSLPLGGSANGNLVQDQSHIMQQENNNYQQPTGAELQLKNALTYRPVHQGRSCIWGSDLAPDCDMMDVVSPAASSTSSSTSTNKNSSCGATGASATCGASSMFPTLHQTVGMANVASSNASSATATPAPSPVPLACFPPVTAQKRTHACRELFEQGQPTESGMKRMKIDTSAPVAELKQLFGGNNTNSDTNTSSVFTTFGKFQERPDGSFPGYIGSGFMSR